MLESLLEEARYLVDSTWKGGEPTLYNPTPSIVAYKHGNKRCFDILRKHGANCKIVKSINGSKGIVKLVSYET